jgi:hypothetical protein
MCARALNAVLIIHEGPETERSTDNLLCFPAEHTVYPMTVKTASNRFALKKRFSQFVALDAQVRPPACRNVGVSHERVDEIDVRGIGFGGKVA